jgi:hypothetical protein
VAGAGQGIDAVRVEVQSNAGRKAALKTAVEAAIEAGENFGRGGM